MTNSMVLGLPGRVVFPGLRLALAPVSVLSQEPPPGLVWYVRDELNRASLDIEDPTNRPVPLTEPPADVLMPVDVNRDGVADWLIRWPEDQRFCGTGGCRLPALARDGGPGNRRGLSRFLPHPAPGGEHSRRCG